MGFFIFMAEKKTKEKEVGSSLTTDKEKVKRFNFINTEFMGKYLDLVWFARSDPDRLVEEEKYEMVLSVQQSLQKIADKYPREVEALVYDETSWQHGFNSGILAYARFISTYIEDGLWELGKDNEDIAQHEKVITINGKQYIEFDGRQDAFDSFPCLDT